MFIIQKIVNRTVNQEKVRFPADHLFYRCSSEKLRKTDNFESKVRFISMEVKGRKIKWSAEEDEELTKAIDKHGTRSWKLIAQYVPGRTGKQCRERWLGQLCPGVVKNGWTQQEDYSLIHYQQRYGNRWAIIARYLPGRTAISIKNRWSWLQRHRRISQECDIREPIVELKAVEEVPCVQKKRFEPIRLPDPSIFGSEFVEFQKMLNVL